MEGTSVFAAILSTAIDPPHESASPAVPVTSVKATLTAPAVRLASCDHADLPDAPVLHAGEGGDQDRRPRSSSVGVPG